VEMMGTKCRCGNAAQIIIFNGDVPIDLCCYVGSYCFDNMDGPWIEYAEGNWTGPDNSWYESSFRFVLARSLFGKKSLSKWR
jgi:hypothetical protein